MIPVIRLPVAFGGHRWRGALTTAVVVSLPLAFAAVWTKHHLLTAGTWDEQSRLSDGVFRAVPFILADVFQALVVTPLVLTALFGWLSGRRRVVAMAGVTLCLTGFVAVGWLTFLGIGGWPTVGLTSEFVTVMGTDAGLINPAAYLPPGTLRTAALLVAFAALPLLLAIDRIGRGLQARAVARTATASLLVALGAGVARAAIGAGGGIERGVMFRLLSGFTQPLSPGFATESGASGGPETDWSSIVFPDPADGRRPGVSAAGRDRACRSAILVVLETAADRDYSWETLRSAMPLNRWYLERAVVGRRHLTTHARSNRADFTMFSGVYDVTDDRPIQTYLRRAGAQSSGAPGIAAMLRKAGYDTRYYFPSRFTIEDDDWAVSYLGFEHVFQASHRFARVLDKQLRVANERQIFERAVSDLQSMDPDRPFFIVLRTIIGHDPTFSPRSGKTLNPNETSGRAEVVHDVLAMVDSLLRNVVVAASQREDSSRIAIAVLSDHGIRNFRDPDLVRQQFPLVRYQVPAVISCPSLFDTTVFTSGATSHVDISPTLAWVLGQEPATDLSHGLVMTDPRLPRRFTFLFAAKAGVDAVVHGDTITTVNQIDTPSYRVLMGPSATSTTLIDRGSAVSREAESRFAAVHRAQYDVIERLSRKEGKSTNRGGADGQNLPNAHTVKRP